jgi:hypothetical protein
LDRVFLRAVPAKPNSIGEMRKVPGFENVVPAGPVGWYESVVSGHDLVFCENTCAFRRWRIITLLAAKPISSIFNLH